MPRKEKDIDVTSETLGPEIQEDFLADVHTGDVVNSRPMTEEEKQFPLPLGAAPESGETSSEPETECGRSCETCANLYQQPNAGEDDPCFDCGNDDARPNWQAGEGSEETQPEAA